MAEDVFPKGGDWAAENPHSWCQIVSVARSYYASHSGFASERSPYRLSLGCRYAASVATNPEHHKPSICATDCKGVCAGGSSIVVVLLAWAPCECTHTGAALFVRDWFYFFPDVKNE